MPAISGPLMMSSGAAPSARLQFEIGDQAVLGAFDDVVGEALIERQVGGFLLCDLRAGLRKIFGDRGDVELIDGGFLLGGLLAPVLGGARDSSGWRRVEQQASARRRSSSGMEAKRSSFSALTMARSSPALVQ